MPFDCSSSCSLLFYYFFCKLLKDFDSAELCDVNMEISKMVTLDKILPLIRQKFVDQWLVDVILDESRTGNGGNKLRSYRSLKQYFQF